jgi:tRNA dimethylallyltransferase
MLEAGLLAEVRAFAEKRPPDAEVLQFEKAIGLREMRAHLADELALPDAVSAMQQASRRYAKRQITWFKREHWLQTICLDSQQGAEWAASHLIDLFPCLLRPSPPTLSLSI